MRCCPALEGRAITQEQFEQAFSSYGARETALTVFLSVAQRVYFEGVWARAVAAKASPDYVSVHARGPLKTQGGVTYTVCHGFGDAIHKIDALLPALGDAGAGAAVILSANERTSLAEHLESKGFASNVHVARGAHAMLATFRKKGGEAPPAASGEPLWAKPVGHFSGSVGGGAVVHYRFDVGGESLEVTLTDGRFWQMAKSLGVDLESDPDPETMEAGPEMDPGADPAEVPLFERVATSPTVPEDVQRMFGRDPKAEWPKTKSDLPKRVYAVQARSSTSLRKLIDRPYNLLTGVILMPDDSYLPPATCAAVMVAPGLLTKSYAESVAKLCVIAKSK